MEPDIYLVGHRCMKGLLGVAGYLICDSEKNQQRWTMDAFFFSTFVYFFMEKTTNNYPPWN